MVAKTGLAPATVHRLLSTLVKTGWLEQDPKSARYELSVKMLGSAAIVLASSPLLRYGRHFLSGISDATGLNRYLAVLRRRGSVLPAQVQGKAGSASDPKFQIGETLPFHATASGKLFLAFLPESGRRGRSGLRRLAQAATARLRGLPPAGDDPRRGGVLTRIRPVRTLVVRLPLAVVYLNPADNLAGPVWDCPRDVNRTVLTS